jgi:hypothetical protein
MQGAKARNLARDAGLYVVPVAERGVVRLARGVLEVGPDASPDAIATIALRLQLEHDNVRDERAVRELVADFGFEYVAPPAVRRGASGLYRMAGS